MDSSKNLHTRRGYAFDEQQDISGAFSHHSNYPGELEIGSCSEEDGGEEDEDEIYDAKLRMMTNPDAMTQSNLDKLTYVNYKGLVTLNLAKKLFNFEGIHKFPPALLDMQNIEELDLRSNDIRELPDDVAKLKNLKILNLSLNELKVLPKSVRLEKLEEFYCEQNQLQDITDFLKNTKRLTILDCSCNPLHTISPIGKELSSLKKLVCQDIGLLETPECLTEYFSLNWLDLSKNPQLQKIDYLPPNIETLHFLYCKSHLSKFDKKWSIEALERCKKLRWIAGGSNGIESFPRNLWNLNALIRCSLSNNRLKVLPSQISLLKNLQALLLDQNMLRFLPESLCELENLMSLSIDRNKIEELPLKIYQLKKLSYFEYESNPWICPPIEILKRGIPDVMEYFLELKCSIPFNVQEQKIILLGDSGSGKTSLINALKDGVSKLTSQEERTVVLELHNWQPKLGMTFQLNDFGGHDIYQVTHPFFLNANALHLLVFDASQFLTNDKQELFHKKIIPWLVTLQDIVPGAVVYLVGTHIDEMTGKECVATRDSVGEMIRTWQREQFEKIDRQLTKIEDLCKQDPKCRKRRNEPLSTLNNSQLKKRKERLCEMKSSQLKVNERVYLVSSAQSLEGVNTLTEKIIHPSKSKVIPKSWYQLMDHIKAESKFDILPIEKVREIGLKLFKIDRCLETALRYFHDTGRILWYSGLVNVDTMVFHKVTVLVELLKALFRHDAATFLDDRNPIFKNISKHAFKSMRDQYLDLGNVAFKLLECLWGHFNLGTDTILKLCELLEKFNLCYRFEDDDPTNWAKRLYHVPWLLQETASTSRFWPKKVEIGQVQLQIEIDFYDHFPYGFYKKSSVALHILITDRVKEWKHGVMAKVNKDRVYLTSDPSLSTMILATRSLEIASAWKTIYPIYEKLKELLEEWPGKQFDIYEICPHCLIEDNQNAVKFPWEVLEQPPPKGLEVKRCPTDGAEIEIEYIFVHPDAAPSKRADVVKQEPPSFFTSKKWQPSAMPKYRVSSTEGYFSKYFKTTAEAKRFETQPTYAISDSQLSQLARNLPNPAWQQFALEILEVPHSYITQIKAEGHSELWVQIFKVFDYWRRREGSKVTVVELQKLLRSAAKIGIYIDEDYIQLIEGTSHLVTEEFKEVISETKCDDFQQSFAISDSQLSQIARNLPHPMWQQFAIEILKVPNNYIIKAGAEKPSDIWAQTFQVLYYWRQKEGSNATIANFKKLLQLAAEIGICIDEDCILPLLPANLV